MKDFRHSRTVYIGQLPIVDASKCQSIVVCPTATPEERKGEAASERIRTRIEKKPAGRYGHRAKRRDNETRTRYKKAGSALAGVSALERKRLRGHARCCVRERFIEAN